MIVTLANGSKRVTVSVRNNNDAQVTIKKGTAFAQVDYANVIQKGPPKDRPTPPTRMSAEERQTKVVEEMQSQGLKNVQSSAVRQKAEDLLREYHDVFSIEKGEIGRTDLVKHEIKLTDENPFKDRPSHIPPNKVGEVRDMLQEMLDVGTITPSNSPWSNAIVLVWKKGGDLRMCIDFCKLNELSLIHI